MHIKQRTVVFGLMMFQLLVSIVVFFSLNSNQQLTRQGLIIAIVSLSGLLIGYWRYNWAWIPAANVLIASLLVSFLLIDPTRDRTISMVFFIPAALALVMTNAIWTIITALIVLVLVIARASASSPYTEIDQIGSYLIIATCLYIGRRMIEQEKQRAEEALTRIEQARDQLQQLADEQQAQAAILQQKNSEQQQLLATISELELPLVEINPRVALVPLIGYISAERMQAITTKLLQLVRDQAIRQLVLDVSGIKAVETDLVHELHNLIQALRLVGTNVTLSGIPRELALALSHEKALRNIRTVRRAYEAIE